MTRKIIKDSGWSKKVLRLLKGATLTVGVHEFDDARSEDEITNAMVGFWQEYGTSKIPPRSFLRSTYDEKITGYKIIVGKLAAKAARGEIAMDKVLHLFGLRVVADVKEKIRSHIEPPIADTTVKAKGSSTPLIDTGQLINSIDYEVSTGV